MNKQSLSILIYCVIMLASSALISMNASAQGIQHSDKVVRSFIDKMEHGKDSVDLSLYVTIMQLHWIAEDAYQFKIRPKSIGGGEGSYSTYTLNRCPDSRIGGMVAQAADSIT